MADLPPVVAKAFDNVSTLLGGAGSRLESLSAQAPAYSSAIAANLSKVGVKTSPNFLGDFMATTANSSPAATAPESAQALEVSPSLSWGVIALGAVILWGLFGRR